MKQPYAHTAATMLIHDKVAESPLPQRHLALMMGFKTPNALSMIKIGSTRVPIDRVEDIARVLDIDVVMLYKLALEQWKPGICALLWPRK